MELLLLLILIAVGGLPLLFFAAVGAVAVAVLPFVILLLLIVLGAIWQALTGALGPVFDALGSILAPLAPSDGAMAFVVIFSFYGLLIWCFVARTLAKRPTELPPIPSARPQSLPRWARAPSARTACK